MDDLKKIFETENNNIATTIKNFPKETELLNRIFNLYKTFYSELRRSPSEIPENYIPELIMLAQIYRGVIICTRLTLQGALPEAMTLLSRCAEAVGVARKLNKHEHLKKRWLEADSNFRNTLGKGKKLFPESDKLLYPTIYNIYNTTSNFGRHPNFVATLSTFDIFKKDIKNIETIFSYPDFNSVERITYKLLVNYFIHAYLNFLRVFIDLFRKNLSKTYIARYKKLKKEFENHKFKLNPFVKLPNQ